MATVDTAPREALREKVEGLEEGGHGQQAGDVDSAEAAMRHKTGGSNGADKAQ